jgi:hypothetical protein
MVRGGTFDTFGGTPQKVQKCHSGTPIPGGYPGVQKWHFCHFWGPESDYPKNLRAKRRKDPSTKVRPPLLFNFVKKKLVQAAGPRRLLTLFSF